jgi:hypothetical protein
MRHTHNQLNQHSFEGKTPYNTTKKPIKHCPNQKSNPTAKAKEVPQQNPSSIQRAHTINAEPNKHLWDMLSVSQESLTKTVLCYLFLIQMRRVDNE